MEKNVKHSWFAGNRGVRAHTGTRSPLGVGLVALTMVAVNGCSAPERPNLTDAQLAERAATDTAQTVEVVRDATANLVARLWKKVEASTPESPATMHFLAMSGGGDYGAFGAGFLVGWGSAPGPGWSRPEFDAVTGVSTGALLAPFAFLGTDESCRTVETFYRNPQSGWVESRGPLFFLPSNPSFMIIPKLEASLRGAIDRPMIEQMAAQYRAGRMLAISATNLDLGRQHVWNLGKECQTALETGNIERVQDILLASAAIPAAFPPVIIDDTLYADGGVTANVFLRLDPDSPIGVIQTWKRLHPDTPLPRVRYWIIINNQLNQPPSIVQEKWPSVLGPSLATAIRSATLAEVRWLAAQARYVNALMGTDIEVRVVAIPDEWRAPVKGDFQKATMESLADLGRKLGADPASWQLWASPRAAPSGTPPGAPPAQP